MISKTRNYSLGLVFALTACNLAEASNIPADAHPKFPDPGDYRWEVVAEDFDHPLALINAGDGTGRLFVVEKAGVIWVIGDSGSPKDPFLDIRDRVDGQKSERGLLSLAFHPRYLENGFFYVNYTDLEGDTVIARFQVSEDPNLADPASEMQLLLVAQPSINHNGGGLVFGSDGYLYIGLGDGGSNGDPRGNGQDLNTLLGKILRIDVDGGSPYAIPADNPFAGGGGLPEIWAYGLRNPWRFSFDASTDDLYIGDVGESTWEEVDFLPGGTPGGANFGWNYREASHMFKGSPLAGLSLIGPVIEYSHSDGHCSIIGGFVYRGEQLPD